MWVLGISLRMLVVLVIDLCFLVMSLVRMVSRIILIVMVEFVSGI